MAEKQHDILAINPGSTSTKFAVFTDEREQFTENLKHAPETLLPFSNRPILAQLTFRLQLVLTNLRQRNVAIDRLAAVVGRGGLLKPLASGTYTVNEAMREDLRLAKRGDHASNLGAFLADNIAQMARCPAFIVDPVSVDEWPEVARLSGMADLDRECLSHALNTKAIAKRFAREQKRDYAALRLIVAHLGSGISISAHQDGKMVDVTNSREEGAFSTERAGTLPVMKLVDQCFSGKFTQKEMETKIFREGGIYSYLQTHDLSEVEARIGNGDSAALRVFEAMSYQIGKEIGAMAAVLAGKIDAILLTGGMAYSRQLVQRLTDRIRWIAPVHVYPGEDELRALADGALRVLRGEEEARTYKK